MHYARLWTAATVAGIFAAHVAHAAPSGATAPAVREAPGRIEVALSFAAPALEATHGITRVSMPGLLTTIDPGLPSLPFQTVKLALPEGAVLDGATLESTSAEHLMHGVVKTSGVMLPLSWHGHVPADAHLIPADAPHITTATYPRSRLTTSVQYLHGVPIVIANVYPVVVDQDGATMHAIDGAKIALHYHVGNTHVLSRPLFRHEAERVAHFVDNASAVTARTAKAAANTDGYDYLIVTSTTLKAYTGDDDLTALVADLARRHLRARVVTVDEAIAGMTGADTQEKLRNYVRQEYQASGIRYLLLAADGDASGSGAVIPARRMAGHVYSYDGSWAWLDAPIPADLYYGNLDGTFNANGNDKWGEATDGVNGGDVDFLAEVTVGRMPMKTATDLANFVRKTIAAGGATSERKTLLMGEELFPELDLYGDDYMDQLVGQCTDHGFTTNGYPASWKEDKLYDRVHSWSSSQAVSEINGGNYAMVNHLGHSNQTYNMRMSSSGINGFTNAKPYFYYTQGCFPGDFTTNDSFIEKLVRHRNGAYAAIANTCYGLAPEDPTPSSTKTPGASHMLHRQFMDQIFSQGVTALGDANVHSKEAFIGLASANEIRWVTWDATFFGDPAVTMTFASSETPAN